MPFSSGSFSLVAGNPVVTGTVISSTIHNNTNSDIATGLSTCVLKDGSQTLTGNIPFGGFKATGLGAATARTDAASLANIQDGTGVYVPTVGGTADVITLTASPAITAYAVGQTFRFIASGANTTAVTVNVSALGAKDITKNGSVALVANDIPSGVMVQITYDGTRFILNGPQGLPMTGGIVSGNITTTSGQFTAGVVGTSGVQITNSGIVGTIDAQALSLRTSSTARITVASGGGVTVAALAGTGTRQVLADTNGLLSTTDAPSLTAEVATTSGTSVTISTTIPATARMISVLLRNVGTNGTSQMILQIGPAAGVETSAYIGVAFDGVTPSATSSAGFILSATNAAADEWNGVVNLVLQNSSTNSWVAQGDIGSTAATNYSSLSGGKSLAGVLTQIRITTAGGVNTFDSGAISLRISP